MKNKKTVISLILAALLLLTLLSGCGAKSNKKNTESENFAEKKIGFVTGAIHEQIAEKHYPEAELCGYNTYPDLAEALESGKIDGYVLDEPAGRLMMQSYPNQSLSEVIEPAAYAYAFAKNDKRGDKIREQLDSFIEECRENGVLKEIDELWLGTDEERKTVNTDELTGENGTIRFAISTDAGAPFIYFKEDKLVGYEIDLMARFCAKYGYKLEMTNYSFSSLMVTVSSGKADIAASTIAITEERKESMNFSLPTYEGGVAVMTKDSSKENEGSSGQKRAAIIDTHKRIGVMAGTTHEDAVKKYYPDAEICYYNTSADLTKALENEEIDLYLLDEPAARMAVQSYVDQHVSEIIEPAEYAFAFQKGSARGTVLREQMNTFIEKNIQSGVLEETKKKWLGTDEKSKVVELDNLTGQNGTLRFAVSTDASAPFIYYKEDKLVGYEIDLISQFCAEYGYNLEITNGSFPTVLPALAEGMYDLAAASIAITPERKETLDFSLPTYESGIVAVKKNSSTDYLPDSMVGKRIGVIDGSSYEPFAKDYYTESEICPYKDNDELAAALDKGEIDAYMLDEPIGRLLIQSHPGQSLSPIIEASSYGFAFAKDNAKSDQLREQMDAFIKKSHQNGVMQELDDIWFGTDENLKTIPFDSLTGKNGTIRLGVSIEAGAPFVYFKNGSLVGYEIDFIVRFCKEQGYALEITSYSLSNLLTAVTTGKADMASCLLTITAERQKIVNFSVPSYEGGIVLAIKGAPEFTTKDFSGKKVGVMTGTILDEILKKYIPDAIPEYIDSYSDLAMALDKGKIDGFVADQPVVRLMQEQYPDQKIAIQLEDTSYGFMFQRDEKHQEICNQLNEFITQSWKDGTMADIDSIWFGNDESLQDVDISDLTAENGVLEMGVTTGVGAPFAYLKDDHMVGYDVDVAARFCRAYGYGLHITDYSPGGVLNSVPGGKADMAASSISITPERQETMLMSEPDYIGGIVLVARTIEPEEEEATFWSSLKESFERTFIRENRWKLFLSGLGVTFMITIISMILGTLGGFIVYLIIRRNNKIFNGVWAFFASVMGRTPVVVILMILYYVIFGRSNLSNVWVSIIGFTLLFTCTVAELLKMGAGAVDSGQTEAALAMGFSARQTYFRIILPQSIEHFLPAFKSEVITLVKATAIVGYIAVQDLTKVSDLVRGRTYEAFFPLIATAIIYYLLTFVLTGLVRRVNVVTDPRRRSEKRIFRGVKRK